MRAPGQVMSVSETSLNPPGRILVTGGAGYVGSHTVQHLVDRGFQVTVVDDLSTGHRGAVPPAAELVVLSLANADQLEALLLARRPQAVMHFAARSLVGEAMQRPLDYLAGNISEAANLLRAVLAAGVQRVVVSSTANVYGDPERTPITEQDRLCPSSPYGESKLYMERMLAWLGKTRGLRWATLRYFNAAGADLQARRGEDHDPETHLIPIVLGTALGLRPSMSIFGDDYPTADGTCIRDYVHVVDLADAHLLALEKLSKCETLTLNLGSETGYSVREVVEVAREATKREIPVSIGERRPGDPAILVASAQAARQELGWSPRHSDIHTIVESAWRWHSARPGGFGD